MATAVTPNVGTQRRYRLLRVALSPPQESEDEINKLAAQGYAVKSVTGDGAAMVLLFELQTT